MKKLKFKNHYKGYNPGEVAGFSEDIAAKLIAAKIAVPVDDVVTEVEAVEPEVEPKAKATKAKAADLDAGAAPIQGA